MESSPIFSPLRTISKVKRGRPFFCDPIWFPQKVQIERNHILLHDIVPKGASFDHFTQDIVIFIREV